MTTKPEHWRACMIWYVTVIDARGDDVIKFIFVLTGKKDGDLDFKKKNLGLCMVKNI